MKIRDSVKIKKGVIDPDFEKYDMSGCQGRIIEADQIDGIQYEIELDSITLKEIPKQYIYDSLNNGNDYAIMYVSISEVIKVEPRDTLDEVRAVRIEMNEKLDYVSVLDEDENVTNILSAYNVILKVRDQRILYDDLIKPSLN